MSSSTPVQRIQELAARTPPDRNRYVDFLRVAAIAMVVLGHWLAVTVRVDDGRLRAVNTLVEVPWTHWATWLFQVMPIFFLVGGYANTASWDSHRSRGGDWASWVHRRAVRLLWPTTTFFAFGLAATLAARAMGVDPDLLEEAGWFLIIMIWFLAVYLGVTAVAPLLLAAYRRWAWRVPALVVVAVVAVDVMRIAVGITWVGNLNYALVWAGIHVLGFAWRDADLVRSDRRLVALGVTGTAAVIALTTAGPYPVSMISVPGADLQNTAPPSLALLCLAAAQAGWLLLARDAVQRWLERSRAWVVVVGANAVVLTVFLWHVVPALLVGPLLHLTGVMPAPPIGSAAWLGLRIPWVAALAVVLGAIVAVVGRWEDPPSAVRHDRGRGHTARARALTATGVVACCGGIVLLTDRGLFHPGGPVGVPLAVLAVYAAGLVLLDQAGRAATWPHQA